MMTVHSQIETDAKVANTQALNAGPIACTEFESLKGLIDSATVALLESMPSSFEHRGKTYGLMIDIQLARVAVFENIAAEKSMLVTLICSPNDHDGHLNGGRNGHATS
jgi:hypothetical protein